MQENSKLCCIPKQLPDLLESFPAPLFLCNAQKKKAACSNPISEEMVDYSSDKFGHLPGSVCTPFPARLSASACSIISGNGKNTGPANENFCRLVTAAEHLGQPGLTTTETENHLKFSSLVIL